MKDQEITNKGNKENAGHLFRFWTWKKFFFNFLFFLVFNMLLWLIFETIDYIKSDEPFSYETILKEGGIQSFIISILVTLWSPDNENIFALLIKKWRLKTNKK